MSEYSDKVTYDCCSEPDINESSMGQVCNRCYSIVDELVYEIDPVFNKSNNNRQKERKYRQYISSLNLPWSIRETLFDSFPRLINHFNTQTTRENFVNINQVVIELLKLWGYSEHALGLKGLKTASRVKNVRLFVREAFGIKDPDAVVKVNKLEDVLQSLDLNSPEYIPDPRVPIDVINKIYY